MKNTTKKSKKKNCKINLENIWSCGMKKCVDSSILLVVQYYGHENFNENIDSETNVADRVDNIGNISNDCGRNHENRRFDYENDNNGINDGEFATRPSIHNNDDFYQISRLFIGSHGGDFSAIDAVSGIYIFLYFIYICMYIYILYIHIYMNIYMYL
jgi:hypothetical protein